MTDEQPFALCAAAALAILFVVFATWCADSSDEAGLRAAWRYPVAERGAQVDYYHGVTVADPYRWLDNTEAQVTADWIAAQN